MNEDELYVKVLSTIYSLNNFPRNEDGEHNQFVNYPNVNILIVMQDMNGVRLFRAVYNNHYTTAYGSGFFTHEGIAGRITNDILAEMKGGKK
jgi:hypothetical protein